MGDAEWAILAPQWISGRKRHLPAAVSGRPLRRRWMIRLLRIMVATQGFVLPARVHPADARDCRAAELVLDGRRERQPTILRLFADMAYQGLGLWLEERLGWRLSIVKRPSRWIWVPVDEPPPPAPASFQVLPKCWIDERTFAWLSRQRRLAKDRERLTATTETWIYLAMSRLDYPDTV